MENEFVDAILDREYAYPIYSSRFSAKNPPLSQTPSKNKITFKPGDIVKLKTGFSPIVVTNVTKYTLDGKYQKSGKFVSRNINDFEIYTEEEKEMVETNSIKDKLFEVVVEGKESRYGVGLAINNAGKYVLDMKDTGAYEAFDASVVKKVMPYTFDVVFVGSDKTKYSYLGTAGSVEVDDLLIVAETNSMVRVVAVDTASERATKRFVGRKLVTEALV